MHDRRDDGVSPVRGFAGIARATAVDGPDATAATDATTAAAATLPTAATGSTDAVAALVAALTSGATTPAAAQDRLIATTVAGLRPADADPAVWAAIEAEVAAALAGDPTLGDLLRP